MRIQVHTSSQTKGLERGWKQRARLGEAKNTPHTPYGRARLARARLALTPRFTDFFTDFEKKLTVLQSSQKEEKKRKEKQKNS